MINDEILLQIIKDDDLVRFKEAIKDKSLYDKECLDVNEPDILENFPKIKHVCAFYGSKKIMDEILTVEMDLEEKDESGLGILQFAAENSHIDMIDFLITEKNVKNETIGFYTLRKGMKNLFLQLLDRDLIDINGKDVTKSTYLHIACNNGDAGLVKTILTIDGFDINAKDVDGRTGLHYACGNGFVDTVEVLLNDNRVNRDIEDNYKRLALYYAIEQEHTDIINLFFDGDVNRFLENGQTELDVACREGKIKHVEMLLQIPTIDVNKQNSYGLAPLHFACRFNHLKIVELLLRVEGIDINILSNEHKTPIHYALEADSFEIANCLILAGADTSIKDADGVSVADLLKPKRNTNNT